MITIISVMILISLILIGILMKDNESFSRKDYYIMLLIALMSTLETLFRSLQ